MSQLIKIADWSGAHRTSVVFVHGLGGHAYDTWRRGANDGTFWPLWLAEEVKGLTVFSLSYESPASNWLGTAMPLHDQAVNVLRRLLAEPDLKQAPIAFVCHSLGGLVIKQLLRDANEQRSSRPDVADFFARTKLVVFLATPHTGSAQATFLDRIRFIAWPSASAKDLVANDPGLRSLNVGYRRLAEERRETLRHLVYYEMHDTAAGRIVKEGPGDPGLPLCDPAPIPADHVAICKPKDRQDLVFTETRDAVAQLAPQPPDTGALRVYPLDPIKREWSWGQVVPKVARLATIALIGGGLAWLLIDTKSQAKFDAIYDQTFSNAGASLALMSAHNSLINVLPQNILSENGPQQWSAVSSILTRSVAVVEGAYKPLAFCLASEECRPGWRARALCRSATAEWDGYKTVYAKLMVMPININLSGGPSMFGDAFGPEVRMPGIPNLGRVLLDACGVDVDDDAEFRKLMVDARDQLERRQKDRGRQWDEAMCPAFSALLDATIAHTDVAAIVNMFPTPPNCKRNADGQVECAWIDPIERRGRYIGAVMGGNEVGNRDVIERPLNACFKGKAESSEDIQIEDKPVKVFGTGCPIAVRRYRMVSSSHVYTVTTDTESCDTILNFSTTVKLDVKDPP
jgi:pimeloyl-ACP methyl ester carboxylesterase